MSTFPSISYYLGLLTSEYQLAPNWQAWLSAPLGIVNDINTCVASMVAAFDLDTAEGDQLDVIGQILGASRTVGFQPSGGGQLTAAFPLVLHAGSGYLAGDILDVLEPGASNGQISVVSVVSGIPQSYTIVDAGENYTTTSPPSGFPTSGGTGTGAQVRTTATAQPSPVLDDPTYRIYLMAKIMQNQWNGQQDALYSMWQQLFPGGRIAIEDNQNMTATIFLSGAFTQIIEDLITNGYIVPRPEGVLYNYIFSQLPVFGFDLNNSYVGGFDEGYWS